MHEAATTSTSTTRDHHDLIVGLEECCGVLRSVAEACRVLWSLAESYSLAESCKVLQSLEGETRRHVWLGEAQVDGDQLGDRKCGM